MRQSPLRDISVWPKDADAEVSESKACACSITLGGHSVALDGTQENPMNVNLGCLSRGREGRKGHNPNPGSAVAVLVYLIDWISYTISFASDVLGV